MIHFNRKEQEKTHKQRKNIKELIHNGVYLLHSIRIRLLVIMLVFCLLPMLLVWWISNYFYHQNLVENEVAQIQTKAAVIAGEFNGYESLTEAKSAGVYDLLVRYSSINALRIRVVNPEFVIDMDSYSVETGKILVNARVIRSVNSKKSYSESDSKNGAIEAVVPITNHGEVIGVLVLDTDVSEIISFEMDVYVQVRVVVTGLLIIFVLFAIIISKRFGSKFKEAFAVITDVANGHVEKRLKPQGYMELVALANDFNKIMDKASAQDASRQEFVSNVSHELRTPITSIKVLADSLNMQEDVPVELYREFMQDITKEIDRESKIIEDLLSIVRMDNPVSTLNIASVNVNELMEMVLTRLKPIAEKKNIEILFESFRPVVAEIDEVKFTQVLSNLVDNAIKYNNIDGWVHVSLNADYQYFYVRVEDSGIGIPEDSQDMVFERFYRVDKARSRETGGTGLGLAIVRKIILMHHGTIKVHSEENVGTTFTVRIPLNYVEKENL